MTKGERGRKNLTPAWVSTTVDLSQLPYSTKVPGLVVTDVDGVLKGILGQNGEWDEVTDYADLLKKMGIPPADDMEFSRELGRRITWLPGLPSIALISSKSNHLAMVIALAHGWKQGVEVIVDIEQQHNANPLRNRGGKDGPNGYISAEETFGFRTDFLDLKLNETAKWVVGKPPDKRPPWIVFQEDGIGLPDNPSRFWQAYEVAYWMHTQLGIPFLIVNPLGLTGLTRNDMNKTESWIQGVAIAERNGQMPPIDDSILRGRIPPETKLEELLTSHRITLTQATLILDIPNRPTPKISDILTRPELQQGPLAYAMSTGALSNQELLEAVVGRPKYLWPVTLPEREVLSLPPSSRESPEPPSI